MQILCVFYIKRPFEKYHNTLSCPSKIFYKHCFQFLLGLKSGRCGRDEKRAANSGGGGQQSVNSYRPVAFNSFGLRL